MATKLSNAHLSVIMDKCKEYYIFDTYIALAHVSSDINGRYLIQTFTDSKADIVNIVKRHVNAAYKTIYNCLDKLIELNIVTFDSSLNAWVLVDMEKMTCSKSCSSVNDNLMEKSFDESFDVEPSLNDENNYYQKFYNQKSLLGYTNIRNFFLTSLFSKMKARIKRLVIYMSQLADSKSSNFHKSFSMNLLKKNSPWLKVLRTTSVYYARTTINQILEKYSSLFEDHSEDIRKNTLASKNVTEFKFSIKCSSISNKEVKDNAKENLELVKIHNIKEYNLIKERLKFSNINLSSTQIMHLLRSISNIKEWFIKERVIGIIINKYIAIQIHKSRENIKSLPAYAAAVVKAVVEEYKEFKEHTKTIISINSEQNYEAYTSKVDIDNSHILNVLKTFVA